MILYLKMIPGRAPERGGNVCVSIRNGWFLLRPLPPLLFLVLTKIWQDIQHGVIFRVSTIGHSHWDHPVLLSLFSSREVISLLYLVRDM